MNCKSALKIGPDTYFLCDKSCFFISYKHLALSNSQTKIIQKFSFLKIEINNPQDYNPFNVFLN
ncbi:hypothetical protein BpHYR1_038831 [Brachionus plicatilis]|uniref:Uncharacterized protein n=1 Tax=Brachionus plicatilis TaxID=10195 RepID=A0A3M7SA60_BRAPC|nr:hypothetical protein BpHYR1_038831 [Brachionus plicatilis]